MVATLSACSLIDDDLSGCGYKFKLKESLMLETDLDAKLSDKLSTVSSEPSRIALKRHLENIFTDKAHDIDIMFFVQPQDEMQYHIEDTIDASQSEYSFFLPIENYQHLSVANLSDNGVVLLVDSTSSTTSMFSVMSDTVESQHTGLFLASLPINVNDTIEDQTIEVHLHQMNSAVALVVDTAGQQVVDIQTFVSGTANGMMLRDSTFLFEKKVIVKADKVPIVAQQAVPAKRNVVHETVRQQCFSAVCFPSADLPDNAGSYFSVYVYVTLTDGTITENRLTVEEPLLAGDIIIIETQLQDNGQIVPVGTTSVGAHVTLDWKKGSDIEIEL